MLMCLLAWTLMGGKGQKGGGKKRRGGGQEQGGQEQGGGGKTREGGDLTCGYPLPLAPTDPPDDVIANQCVLTLLQANNIFRKHNAALAPQMSLYIKISLDLYQEASLPHQN